jgi:hypothetical protein
MTTAVATATASCYLLENGAGAVFLVKEMERRQADVGDFFLTKDECLVRFKGEFLRGVQGLHCRC